MTLPVSGAMGLLDVLAELKLANPGRSLPISLGDTDVRALAGKPSGAIALSDLRGKSAQPALAAYTVSDFGQQYDSTLSGGDARTFPRVAVTAGTAPYTYSWSLRAGSDPNVVIRLDGTTANPTIGRTFFRKASGVYDVLVDCRVRDAAGGDITVTAGASAEWSSTT